MQTEQQKTRHNLKENTHIIAEETHKYRTHRKNKSQAAQKEEQETTNTKQKHKYVQKRKRSKYTCKDRQIERQKDSTTERQTEGTNT